jgi:hypothetical protein
MLCSLDDSKGGSVAGKLDCVADVKCALKKNVSQTLDGKGVDAIYT